MRISQLNRLKGVSNLRREQVAVLKTDLPRRTFQVSVNPSASFETIGAAQPRIAWRGIRYGLGRDASASAAL